MPRYKWSYDEYHPYFLANQNPAEVRKEYSRLRKIANKRLAALGRSEFRGTRAYQNWKNRFVSLEQLETDANVRHRLVELHTFLESATGSVRKQQALRKQSLETLHEHGYTFVNKKNWLQFGEFMEEARERLLNSYYDSDAVADMFNDAAREKLSSKELEKMFDEYVKSEKERMEKERRKFY